MLNKYLYLHPYISYQRQEKAYCNWFDKVTQEEIILAERALGFEFPSMLKEFWLEVGYGFLEVGYNGQIGDVNRIMDPHSIADLMLAYSQNDPLHPEIEQLFEEGYIKEGDILFFEIGEMASFLMMRSKSENPNAIYDMLGGKVEDSFERFIYRLYYESPEFYFHV